MSHERFLSKLSKVRDRPGMFLPSGDYKCFCSFLIGVFFGDASRLLSGFDQFIKDKYKIESSCRWDALLETIFTEVEPSLSEKEKIHVAFKELEEFMRRAQDS